MKKTTTIILISVLTLAFCCSLLVGATYAIFDTKETSIIEATTGTLDVTKTLSGDDVFFKDDSGTSGRWPPLIPGTERERGYSALHKEDGTIEVALTGIDRGCGLKVKLSIDNNGTLAAKWRIAVTLDKDTYEKLSIYTDYDGVNFNNITDEDQSEKITLVSSWVSIGENGGKVAYYDVISIALEFPYIADSNELFSGSVFIRLEAVHGNSSLNDFDPMPVRAVVSNCIATI